MAVIEHLTVRVPLALQPRYLAADAAVWTAVLSAQPGYLGKEVWADMDDPERLHLVIRWASRADWDAVPRPLLDATEARFRAATGAEIPIDGCMALRVVT